MSMRNGDAQLLEIARHQRARPDERDARAEFEQGKNIRARDAAEKDVADDGDVQSGDASLAFRGSCRDRARPAWDARARRRRR